MSRLILHRPLRHLCCRKQTLHPFSRLRLSAHGIHTRALQHIVLLSAHKHTCIDRHFSSLQGVLSVANFCTSEHQLQRRVDYIVPGASLSRSQRFDCYYCATPSPPIDLTKHSLSNQRFDFESIDVDPPRLTVMLCDAVVAAADPDDDKDGECKHAHGDHHCDSYCRFLCRRSRGCATRPLRIQHCGVHLSYQKRRSGSMGSRIAGGPTQRYDRNPCRRRTYHQRVKRWNVHTRPCGGRLVHGDNRVLCDRIGKRKVRIVQKHAVQGVVYSRLCQAPRLAAPADECYSVHAYVCGGRVRHARPQWRQGLPTTGLDAEHRKLVG
eukprot:Opistho-2@36749